MLNLQMTQLQAIEFVLDYWPLPMTGEEIADEIIGQKLAKLTGETKTKSVVSRISVDIKQHGTQSIFKRTIGEDNIVRYTLRSRPEKEYYPAPRKRRITKGERILAFPPEIIQELGYFQGISTNYHPYVKEILKYQNSFFEDRRDLENIDDFKQVISYALIRRGDSLLRYTRGSMTNISALYGQDSLGFGGHVQEKEDFSMFANDMGYADSAAREITEETTFKVPKDELINSIVGVINDDSTDLGKKHFAIVHLVNLKQDLPVKKGEMSIRKLDFVEFSEINNKFMNLEYWSKLCASSFFGDELSIKSQIEKRARRKLRSPLIVVVGSIGSGKSEACRILEEYFGYSTIRTSVVLKKLLGIESGQDLSRNQLQDLGYKFVGQPNGHRDLAEGLMHEISLHEGKKYAIDGIRYPETLTELEVLIGENPPVLYLENIDPRAYEFYLARETRKLTYDEFRRILAHPVERDIKRFRSSADYIVYNYGSLDSYHREIRTFFNQQLG